LKCATSHYYENVSRQGERRTNNHWHIRPDTYPLHYQDAAACMTNWPLYSHRILRGDAVE